MLLLEIRGTESFEADREWMANRIAAIISGASPIPLRYHLQWEDEILDEGGWENDGDYASLSHVLRLSLSECTTPKILRDTLFHELAHCLQYTLYGPEVPGHETEFVFSWAALEAEFAFLDIEM